MTSLGAGAAVTCALRRDSGDGHQFQRRHSTTMAGTISVRTRNVSISTPSAMAVPSSLIWVVAPVTPATPKVAARIRPAEVTVGPVWWQAVRTAARSGDSCASSRIRLMTRML